MDFRKINLGVDPVKENNATVASITFEGFQNGNGKALVLDLLPFNSPEGDKQRARWQTKFGIGKGAEKHLDADEDELDRIADVDKEGNVELIARMIAGWNVEDGKAGPVEPSLANRKGLMAAFPKLAEAVAEKLKEISRDLGNSKAA